VGRDARSLDLENSNDRRKVAAPRLFLESQSNRLVKSPKVYVRDSGLVYALLGIETLDALAGYPVVGLSWGNFVSVALISQSPWRVCLYFFRTAAGADADL
jgi:uncharacterized protein